MNSDIKITAEQLVKESLQSYKTDHSEPAVLVANTIQRLFPNSDSVTVRCMAIENSVEEGILKLERQAAATESEFRQCGQMSLLGELIPEHKVPVGLINKSTAEMDEWMANRAAIERENADELRRAAEQQERKAMRYEQWSEAVHKVAITLIDNGLNPAEISYAEALAKAETIHTGRQIAASEKAKRPVR